MQIYIHRNNQQIGPFTEDEIKAQLASGALSPGDSAWWQGEAGWVPLSQTRFAGVGSPTSPGAPGIPRTPAAAPGGGSLAPTSNLTIWSLVCGCLSILCGVFTAIPAIILGHMGLSEIKKNPAIQGRGMALAGLIIGYIFTLLFLVIIVISVLIALGKQVKTIHTQLNAAPFTNNASITDTNSDLNASPATNSPDQATNSAPATTNTPDQSTNSPDSTTNAPAANTNAPSGSTNAAPTPATNQ